MHSHLFAQQEGKKWQLNRRKKKNGKINKECIAWVTEDEEEKEEKWSNGIQCEVKLVSGHFCSMLRYPILFCVTELQVVTAHNMNDRIW